MKVWVDISNAPHVRFFKDVIKYLEAEGEDVIVTARQFGMMKRWMSPLASILLSFLEFLLV